MDPPRMYGPCRLRSSNRRVSSAPTTSSKVVLTSLDRALGATVQVVTNDCCSQC